jgi:hypothetical protein
MFIELAFIACTVMGSCRDVSLSYAPESVTVMTCLMGAQPELAKWTNAHPGYQVKRWSCGVAGRYAKI